MQANTFFTHDLLQTLSYETPYFLFSKDLVLKNFHSFNQNFPNSEVYYAIKANSEPEILKLLKENNCGFEVASMYELHYLKKLDVPAHKIIYGTSIKPLSHIKEAFAYGVNRFACDSLAELEKISSVAPGAKIYIRITANDTGSVFRFSEKFGTDTTNVVSLLLHAKQLGLHPYGISFHVGSQASDVYAWSYAIDSLNTVFSELKQNDITIEILDIGGGYPCQYASSMEVPTNEEIAKFTLEAYHKLPYQPKIFLEPGRGIIANTGILVTSVIAKVERKGNTWLFLDAGVYNALFEAMAYQGSTRYPIMSLRSSGDAGEALYALAGPTGDSPDIITKEALLPADIEVGDKIVIYNAGAYTLTTSSPFNGFPRPNVYYI